MGIEAVDKVEAGLDDEVPVCLILVGEGGEAGHAVLRGANRRVLPIGCKGSG